MITVADRAADAPDVVTFGESMLLLRAETGVPLRAATWFQRDVAGAEGNVAVGLARLGHRVQFVLRVGDDPFGPVVVAAYRAEGIDVVPIFDPQRATGVLIRDVLADRPIEVVYHRASSAATALAPGDVPADLIAAARLLHVTGITPVLSDSAAETTYAAVDAARASGTVVSFDPNLRRRLTAPDTARQRWLPIVDRAAIVLAGVDEAEILTGVDGTDRRRTAAWFHERGVTTVVIKDGPAGCWASDGGDLLDQPAMPVVVVDPVGAGDAFAAGLLSSVLDGADLAQAVLAGAAVGARCVQVAGDLAGLPTRVELDQLLGGYRDHISR